MKWYIKQGKLWEELHKKGYNLKLFGKKGNPKYIEYEFSKLFSCSGVVIRVLRGNSFRQIHTAIFKECWKFAKSNGDVV